MPPPGTLMALPQRAKPGRKSAHCGGVDGSPRLHHPHPHPQGSGPRPHAQKDEWSGVEERPTPDAPHPGKRRPLQAPSCRPHSVQSQLARARAVGLVTDPRARTPRTYSQWVVGPGRTPERRRGRGWKSARPRAPRTQASSAPPGRPRAAPTARQASARPARKSARGGVGDGSSRLHLPHGERAAPSQVGGNGTGPPPPKQAKRSTGPRPDTRRGTDRVERPYQCPAPGPREVRAPHEPGEGEGRGRREGTSAHTHTKDKRGKPEGQPDRARQTHTLHGMVYQRASIRGPQTGRPATHSAGNKGQAGGNRGDTTPGTGPNPPERAASAAHTRPGHCTCQGSSGA